MYLDEGAIAEEGKEAANRASLIVQNDLARAGLVVNLAKSTWEPSQQCAWLGFEIDLEVGVITVPQRKVKALLAQLRQATEKRALPVRLVASIIGKIISMSLALGAVARLMTRSLYAMINASESWCQSLPITPGAFQELEFWIHNLRNFNGQGIWHSQSAIQVVYTDASSTGYGGYTVEHGCHIAHGLWLPEEAKLSSTWRELRAVRMVLESLAVKLKNERVRWFTDNQNVARILLYGSKQPALQKEAFDMFALSTKNQIRIEPEWIPREKNQQADYLSHLIDCDDWRVHPAIFEAIDKEWGPHTIDIFASFWNAKLPRFNSRFWNPGRH